MVSSNLRRFRPNYRNWKDIVSRNYLDHLYTELRLSTNDIEYILGVDMAIVWKCLKNYGINLRPKGTHTYKRERELNPNWKGKDVGYYAAHDRMERLAGNPLRCDNCPKSGGNTQGYQWANLTGKFHDPSDYLRLCSSCHKIMDIGLAAIRRMESGLCVSDAPSLKLYLDSLKKHFRYQYEVMFEEVWELAGIYEVNEATGRIAQYLRHDKYSTNVTPYFTKVQALKLTREDRKKNGKFHHRRSVFPGNRNR